VWIEREGGWDIDGGVGAKCRGTSEKDDPLYRPSSIASQLQQTYRIWTQAYAAHRLGGDKKNRRVHAVISWTSGSRKYIDS
jgi:hypothetical protein